MCWRSVTAVACDLIPVGADGAWHSYLNTLPVSGGGLPVLAAMPSPASTTSPAGRVLTWPGLGQSARGEASLKAGDAEKQCEWWLCAGDGGTVTCLQRRLGPKSWNPVLRFLTAELHSVTEPGFPAAENPRSLVCCPSQRAGGLPVATY